MSVVTPAMIAEFWKFCESHDWYYSFSDDNRVWRRGTEQRKWLETQAAGNADLNAIYTAFHDYHFSGKSFGTAQTPKPLRWDGTHVIFEQ